MVTFADAALSLVHTPFHWHQRVSGKHGGIDCLGLIILAGRISGHLPPGWDYLNYGNNEGDLSGCLRTVGKDYLKEIELTESPDTETVLTLRNRIDDDQVRHLGVVVGSQIVHAHITRGVTVDPLAVWMSRADAAFRWKT